MSIQLEMIEADLRAKNASAIFINKARGLFHCDVYNNYLLFRYGLTTSVSYSQLAPIQSLTNLSTMSAIDIEDFVGENTLSLVQAKSITSTQKDLLSDATKELIHKVLESNIGADTDFLRFSMSAFVSTGFPFQKIKGPQHFERVNGNLTVTLSAPNNIGLPYGTHARLIILYICTEIVKSNGGTINLGKSLKDFVVNGLGRNWTTGKNGSAKIWREQLISVISLTITITETVGSARRSGLKLDKSSIIKKMDLWWDKESSEITDSTLEVDQDFADLLLNHAVPLHRDAYMNLCETNSPLAMDVYSFLTYRAYTLEESGLSQARMAWIELMKQTGTGLVKMSRFIEDFEIAIERVKRVWPGLNCSCADKDYFVLYRSTPHVSPNLFGKPQPDE